MDKFIKAFVAAALVATLSASPAYAAKKAPTTTGGCTLGTATYPEGAVVGLLKCKGGKWVLAVDLPTPPKLPKLFAL